MQIDVSDARRRIYIIRFPWHGCLRPISPREPGTCGRSWNETAREPDANRLARLMESWRMGVAPAGVQAVSVSFDVHPDHIWYVVVGWGYLFEA